MLRERSSESGVRFLGTESQVRGALGLSVRRLKGSSFYFLEAAPHPLTASRCSCFSPGPGTQHAAPGGFLHCQPCRRGVLRRWSANQKHVAIQSRSPPPSALQYEDSRQRGLLLLWLVPARCPLTLSLPPGLEIRTLHLAHPWCLEDATQGCPRDW